MSMNYRIQIQLEFEFAVEFESEFNDPSMRRRLDVLVRRRANGSRCRVDASTHGRIVVSLC